MKRNASLRSAPGSSPPMPFPKSAQGVPAGRRVILSDSEDDLDDVDDSPLSASSASDAPLDIVEVLSRGRNDDGQLVFDCVFRGESRERRSPNDCHWLLFDDIKDEAAAAIAAFEHDLHRRRLAQDDARERAGGSSDDDDDEDDEDQNLDDSQSVNSADSDSEQSSDDEEPVWNDDYTKVLSYVDPLRNSSGPRPQPLESQRDYSQHELCVIEEFVHYQKLLARSNIVLEKVLTWGNATVDAHKLNWWIPYAIRANQLRVRKWLERPRLGVCHACGVRKMVSYHIWADTPEWRSKRRVGRVCAARIEAAVALVRTRDFVSFAGVTTFERTAEAYQRFKQALDAAEQFDV